MSVGVMEDYKLRDLRASHTRTIPKKKEKKKDYSKKESPFFFFGEAGVQGLRETFLFAVVQIPRHPSTEDSRLCAPN
jgi:hypothetical protein